MKLGLKRYDAKSNKPTKLYCSSRQPVFVETVSSAVSAIGQGRRSAGSVTLYEVASPTADALRGYALQRSLRRSKCSKATVTASECPHRLRCVITSKHVFVYRSKPNSQNVKLRPKQCFTSKYIYSSLSSNVSHHKP
jgi:hypothetical protein